MDDLKYCAHCHNAVLIPDGSPQIRECIVCRCRFLTIKEPYTILAFGDNCDRHEHIEIPVFLVNIEGAGWAISNSAGEYLMIGSLRTAMRWQIGMSDLVFILEQLTYEQAAEQLEKLNYPLEVMDRVLITAPND